jgi:hypothetical protein
VSRPWSVEAKKGCGKCVPGDPQSLSYTLREHARADFRDQIIHLQAERRSAKQRWLEYQERHKEELVLCRILPESLTLVQAERLLDLYHLFTSDQTEFFGTTSKTNRRLHMLERAIANVPPTLEQGMHVGSLALQAFAASMTLVSDSNEYLQDIFIFEAPEEINLPKMEKKFLPGSRYSLTRSGILGKGWQQILS